MPGGFSDPGLAAGPTFRKAAPMASPAQHQHQHQDPAPPHGALKVQSPACAGGGGAGARWAHFIFHCSQLLQLLASCWAGPGLGRGRGRGGGGGEVINQGAGRHQPQPDPAGPQGLQGPRRVAPDRPAPCDVMCGRVTNIITCHKLSHPSYPSSIKPSKIIQLTSDKNAKSWWKSSSVCFAKLF